MNMETRPPAERPRIVLLDLWCVVPYYTAYLAKALAGSNTDIRLASISYHWDLECFSRQGVSNRPGLLDVVARLGIRNRWLRQGLKLAEGCVNLMALAVQFLVARPAVLHVQFLPLLEYGIPVERWFLRYAKWLGIRIVYTVHNELPLANGERYRAAYRRLYHLSDRLICHTAEARERLARSFDIPEDRIDVIPHGPMFHDSRVSSVTPPQPHGECVVLWQGWLKPYKGIPFLLDAWAEVRRQNARARLVIAGAGDEECQHDIREKVAALQLHDAVQLDFRFLDAVTELPRYYSNADILVYPYREITMSGALMTGLSYGKAVVATALPAFSEVLEHGKSALLVEYGNTAALAGAILTLVQNPGLRARLGAAALQIASNRPNSWISIAGQTRTSYESLLAITSTRTRATITRRGSDECL